MNFEVIANYDKQKFTEEVLDKIDYDRQEFAKKIIDVMFETVAKKINIQKKLAKLKKKDYQYWFEQKEDHCLVLTVVKNKNRTLKNRKIGKEYRLVPTKIFSYNS